MIIHINLNIKCLQKYVPKNIQDNFYLETKNILKKTNTNIFITCNKKIKNYLIHSY